MTRRLAADVVGYSRLVRADEEGVLAELKRLRRAVVDPALAARGGRIVKLMGDGMLVEFPSALEAVRAAMEIQQAMADAPSPAGIAFRIGINIGDIVVEDDDIFGDGVNVAARLEAEAPPGGIFLADTVYQHVRDRIDDAFDDLGERDLKNIDRPVRAWRWSPNQPAGVIALPRRDLPDKPSIAVLAFENMSSDPEHDFFGDGLAEEIITTLSKISNLLVIARNSSFTYKGRAMDLRTVGRELGVRYVLEGSVRALGGRIRVTAQLIDAETGAHVWAECYDRRLEDIFAVQDDITREIVTALQIRLSDGEQRQIRLRGTENVEAWSLALSALDLTLHMTVESIRQARGQRDRAMRLDSDYAAAHGILGPAHWADHHFGFSDDSHESLRRMSEAAERAITLNPASALGHLIRAGHQAEHGDIEAARETTSRVVGLAPGNAIIRAILGRVLVHAGLFREAETNLRMAMRANRHHPSFYFGILANALERQGREDEAIEILRKAVALHPDYYSGHLRLASLLELAGEHEEARRHVEEAERLNPRVNREVLARYYGSQDEQALGRFMEGLENAGMAL